MDLISDIYSEMIQCFKTKNYAFDFSTGDLFVDNGLNGVYVHYEALHREEFDQYMEQHESFFDMNIPFSREKFVSEYKEFIENYCSKKKNTRYAISLTVLYPKKLATNNQKKRFVHELVKQIGGIDCDLPYFVENITQRNGCYAKIIIIERLYLGRKGWKIYKNDKFIDTRTGRFASRDCPAEFKKAVCKAGEYVLDKDGDKIPSNAVFSNNLRIFCFAKDPVSKDNLWDAFIYKLKIKYINAVLLICGKTNTVKHGKRLHKTNNKPEYHRYVRRRISALNYAKQVIEYTTNYLLNKACQNDISYIPYNEGKNIRVKHSTAYNQITGLFMKYKRRFTKKSFHDRTGLERQIDYYDMRVDELDENVEILLDMYFKEIELVNV